MNDKKTAYVVCEVFPAPVVGVNEAVHILCIRDNREAAESILDVLYKTDVSFSCYKIYEYDINRETNNE